MDAFTTTDIPVESPYRLAITPDGGRLYVSHRPLPPDGSDLARTLSVIDTSADAVVGAILLDAEPNAIAMSPTGSQLFVSHTFADLVSVIDTASNAVLATVPIAGNPDSLCVPGDGSRVYVTNSYPGLSVIDATTYAVAPVLQTYGYASIGAMVAARDGVRIYAAVGPHGPTSKGFLMVIDPLATPPGYRAIELNDATAVALSADGSRCYVIDQFVPPDPLKTDLVVVDTVTELVLRRILGDGTPALGFETIAPDPIGRRVYATTGWVPSKVLVLEAASDTVVTAFELGDQVWDLAVRSTDPTVQHIYASHSPSNRVSHTVSTTSTSFTSGELMSYVDVGTPGNVSDAVTVGFGGWQAFTHVFGGGNAAGQDRIYAVDQDGQLLSYGDSGMVGNVSNPVVVGFGGWQAFTRVFAGRNASGQAQSQERIYAVDQDGRLLSYGDAGTPGNVSDPVVVGFGGWQAFRQLFAGRNAAGEPRIYAVDQAGQLLSYADAGTPGNVSDPVIVGFGGWQVFTHVFGGRNAAGEYRIYAVDQDGQLLSYGDAGTPGNVSDPVIVGFGGWQVFKKLFAGRNAAFADSTGRNVTGSDRIYAVVA